MMCMQKNARVASCYLALAAITSTVSCASELGDAATKLEADWSPYDPETQDAVGVSSMKLWSAQCTQAIEIRNLQGGPYYVVPAASNGSQDCWMDRGDGSDAVTALQRALVNCWIQDIDVDGQYGPQTQTAVRTIQGWLGIEADGVYGPETRQHMGEGFAQADLDLCAVPIN